MGTGTGSKGGCQTGTTALLISASEIWPCDICTRGTQIRFIASKPRKATTGILIECTGNRIVAGYTDSIGGTGGRGQSDIRIGTQKISMIAVLLMSWGMLFRQLLQFGTTRRDLIV